MYYLVSEMIKRSDALAAASVILENVKDAEAYGRLWGAEKNLKKVYVHLVCLSTLSTWVHEEHLGFRFRKPLRHNFNSYGTANENYPKTLRVQQRHVADYIERKMLHSEKESTLLEAMHERST